MYWADYVADTMHFNTFQHGIYLLLIASYWRRGGPISAEPGEVATMARTTKDKLARYGNPVLAMFTCKDGLLHHKRIDLEILKTSDRLAAARANGRAGGLAKSKLPTPTLTPTEELDSKKDINLVLAGVGKNGLGAFEPRPATTIKSPHDRIARFQQKLAPVIGDNGWMVILAASDKAHPEYQSALGICKAATKKMGKGWPRNWHTEDIQNGV